MSINGVIFDVSETMLEGGGKAVPGIGDTIKRLQDLGVQIIAAESEGPANSTAKKLSNAGIPVDHIVTRFEVGKNKGSPLWIDHIKQLTGLATNELLYVGDSKYDMITASHSKVVYIHAAWTGTPSEYGLKAPTPPWIAAVVAHIFRKRHAWGWTLTRPDSRGRTIRQLALVDVNTVQQAKIKNDLVEMFKERDEPFVGPMPLREFLALHLTASIYADGLQEQTDVWGMMPSHNGQRVNKMTPWLDTVAKLFRDHYVNNLLVRHRPAKRSRDARREGGIVGAIANQVNTLHLDPTAIQKIAGRTVLILDDFLTKGVTTGVGSVLLSLGGAADTIVVAAVKYGPSSVVLNRPDGARCWDPTQPAPENSAAAVGYTEEPGAFNQDAQNEFIASYQAMQNEHW